MSAVDVVGVKQLVKSGESAEVNFKLRSTITWSERKLFSYS